MLCWRIVGSQVWGSSDNLAPISGPVGRFFQERSTRLDASSFVEIDAGHVPQDDRPETTNRILREWLAAM